METFGVDLLSLSLSQLPTVYLTQTPSNQQSISSSPPSKPLRSIVFSEVTNLKWLLSYLCAMGSDEHWAV